METRSYTNEDDKNIIIRMDSLIGEWDQQADRRVDFLRCYRFMTNNMLKAIQQDEFNDGPWVRLLLVHFADYYFSALSNYDKRRSQTPIVWSTVHNTSNQEGTFVLQNLLLGINTHINYDLVLTLYDILSPEWDSLSAEQRQLRYEDHRHVNRVIARTVDEVQDNVVEPQQPLMDIVDKLLGPVDELSASLLIRKWREEVWQHAQQMMSARDDSEREKVRSQVEQLTLERAKTIIQPSGFDLLDEIF